MLKQCISSEKKALYLSVGIPGGEEMCPVDNTVVGVVVVLFAGRLVPLPVQPGSPEDFEVPPSVAGCQSLGRQGHGLWSGGQIYITMKSSM